MKAQPTDLPAGDRRTVLVTGITYRPVTVPQVLRAAARIIASNSLHQGGLVPDPCDREMGEIPHHIRPMSIVAALRCAVTDDPHSSNLLADRALIVLAERLNGGPVWGDLLALEARVEGWGDAEGRMAGDVIAVLEAAADACEVAA